MAYVWYWEAELAIIHMCSTAIFKPCQSPVRSFTLYMVMKSLVAFLHFSFYTVTSISCVSGSVPEEPVISPKSGAVFERRLIEKYLQESNVDPVSGEELDITELIPVKGHSIVTPRAPNATSIPTLLKTFQDEWDAQMLETFELKKHVMELRQELTHSLYQHDASCRLIARLTRERDQAREALVSLQQQQAAVEVPSQQQSNTTESNQPNETESPLPEEVVASITATHKKLSK
eukprot:gene9068-1382_t